MPLQNRVTPFGEIVAVPERGTMMGNRGILHDAHRRLRRQWAGRAWICCLLEFQGRRDPVMAPGHYTRLFFLDEPTALAAGHRPCAFCRRDAYSAFQTAWATGNRGLEPGCRPRAVQMDRVLHGERLGPDSRKRLHRAELSSLPDGVFVTPTVTEHAEEHPSMLASDDEPRIGGAEHGPVVPGQHAFLVWRGSLWRWSPGGYMPAGPVQPGPVMTLTPPSIVAALANGYTPGPPAGLG